MCSRLLRESHMPAQPKTVTSGNLLLARLETSDRALLEPHLEAVALNLRDVLVHADRVIEHVYFPDQGLASVISSAGDGARLEVGMFGREGLSAPSLLLGVDSTPHETFVQARGYARRIEAAAFTTALRQSATLLGELLKYVQALSVQTAHTAVSNGAFTIEERLARWLLMCHDRLDTDGLPMTHEFLALMLAVRRAGVTTAVQALEGAGLVRAERGLITILDRPRLEDLANGSYGQPEAEYERLMGSFRPG